VPVACQWHAAATRMPTTVFHPEAQTSDRLGPGVGLVATAAEDSDADGDTVTRATGRPGPGTQSPSHGAAAAVLSSKGWWPGQRVRLAAVPPPGPGGSGRDRTGSRPASLLGRLESAQRAGPGPRQPRWRIRYRD
jgi:hypothetical protein